MENLSKKEIIEDLTYLNWLLQEKSSYQGLNGFDYKKAFDNYFHSLNSTGTTKTAFGLFLTETIGLIGDRHAYVRGYDLPNTKFLPFIAAPLDNKVVGLIFDRKVKKYQLLHPQYPYLKSINGMDINDFLAKILPEKIKAPPAAYFTRVVKELKYMERNYARIRKDLPDEFQFVFTNLKEDTTIISPLEPVRRTYITWDEKFSVLAYKEEKLNDPEIAKKHFRLGNDNIGYIRIPNMVKSRKVPVFYETLHEFMQQAKTSKAIIVDVRSNGGGVRHLIFELAKYFIHPDSIYVVNVAQQRAKLPLDEDRKEDLHNRFLYAFDELDKEEQAAVKTFLQSFKPTYQLPKDKVSEYHFAVFNGKKLSKESYHYNKPIYILANERSFSAASVLVALFKGLPNIKTVGVTTDGSSGNSRGFKLPNSWFKGRISTMVSFQKDGQLFDGVGTAPDIEIERNLRQVFWVEDYQLMQLKQLINTNSELVN